MKTLKKFYKDFLKIGQNPSFSNKKNKKIKLLNIYVLIAIHFDCIMPIGDVITGIFNLKILGCYSVMFLMMLILLELNKKGKVLLASFLWVVTILLTILMFSLFLVTETYVEYYYVFIPGVALTLFNDNRISVFIVALCLFLFFVPFYIIEVYSPSIVAKLDPFSAFGIFTCVFLLVNYFKKINTENEQKLTLAYQKLEETKKNELAQLRLKSLKVKMNPHFVFNSMNAIQNLVIKNETKETYHYLSKLSGFIRDNLNRNEENYIDFDDEFALLKKYLELEKLRFKEGFEYELSKNNNTSNLKIPSLIIQPFLENAIQRVFHKKYDVKRIKILFYKSDVLTCVIQDNGVNIEEIDHIDINKEKYFSDDKIQELFQLLKECYQIEVSYKYIYDGVNKYIINIPYKTIL